MILEYIYLAKYVIFMSKAELTSKRKADSMSRLLINPSDRPMLLQRRLTRFAL